MHLADVDRGAAKAAHTLRSDLAVFLQDHDGALFYAVPDLRASDGALVHVLMPMDLLAKHAGADGASRGDHADFRARYNQLERTLHVNIGAAPGEYVMLPATTRIDGISTSAQPLMQCYGGIPCFGKNDKTKPAGSNKHARLEGLSTPSSVRIAAANAHVLFGVDSTKENNKAKKSKSRAAAHGKCLTQSAVHLKAMAAALHFIPEKLATTVLEQQRALHASEDAARESTIPILIAGIRSALGGKTIFEFVRAAGRIKTCDGVIVVDGKEAELDGDVWYVFESIARSLLWQCLLGIGPPPAQTLAAPLCLGALPLLPPLINPYRVNE